MIEFIVSILFIIPVFIYIFRDKRNATGIFCIYFMISCVLPYALEYGSEGGGETFTRFLHTPVAQNAFVILVFSFVVVYFVSIFISKNAVDKKITAYSVDNRASIRFAMLGLLLNFLYLTLTVGIYGGLNEVFESSFKRVQATSSLSNIKSVFYWGGAVFSIVSFYLYDKKTKTNFSNFLMALAVISSLFLSFMNGGRSIFLLFIFALLYKKILLADNKLIAIYSVFFLSFSLLVSYGMILLRYFMQGATQFSNTTQSESLSIAMTGLRYIDHFVISIMYADHNGHDFGKLYLNAIFSFIPRDLWDGKPQLVSASVRNFLFGDYSGGIPPGLFGEGYIAFGLLGVLLVSILYGYTLGKLDVLVRFSVGANCSYRFAFAGIMVPLVGFTLIRGGVDIGVFRLGIPLFWLLVARVILSFYQSKSMYKVSVDRMYFVGTKKPKKLLVF